jgi:hypothetical protein
MKGHTGKATEGAARGGENDAGLCPMPMLLDHPHVTPGHDIQRAK